MYLKRYNHNNVILIYFSIILESSKHINYKTQYYDDHSHSEAIVLVLVISVLWGRHCVPPLSCYFKDIHF